MSGWIKIPDNWVENDKIEALGAEAVLLHLSALSLCSRQCSDGNVPTRALRRLWPCHDLDAAVKQLVKAEEWNVVDDGWHLANWNVHLLSASEVEHRRQVSRESSERFRRHQAGDHSLCERCSVVRGDVARATSRATSVTPLLTQRLDSPRSDSGEGRGEEEDGAHKRSAGATRLPRVLGEEELNLATDLTPWDVSILANDYDNPRHVELFAQPALAAEDAEGFTSDQMKAGHEHFRQVSSIVDGRLANAVAQLRQAHACRESDDPCRLWIDMDLEPILNVTVPRALSDSWLTRLIDTYASALTSDHDERSAS